MLLNPFQTLTWSFLVFKEQRGGAEVMMVVAEKVV
jgi:hypothetical protein